MRFQPDALLRRAALLLAGLFLTFLWGCAAQPSAAETEARGRVRFEDTAEGARAILSESILFETGKTTFANAAEPVLDVLKPAFDKARGKIIVEGHTDGIGTDAANKRLSQERAEKVRAAIVARQVPPNRVEAKGLGKDKPRVTPEVSDQDRQLNRRAEILFPGETVDSLGGREIEGKADSVLGQLSKALSQVKDDAKGAFEKLRDTFRSDSSIASKPWSHCASSCNLLSAMRRARACSGESSLATCTGTFASLSDLAALSRVWPAMITPCASTTMGTRKPNSRMLEATASTAASFWRGFFS